VQCLRNPISPLKRERGDSRALEGRINRLLLSLAEGERERENETSVGLLLLLFRSLSLSLFQARCPLLADGTRCFPSRCRRPGHHRESPLFLSLGGTRALFNSLRFDIAAAVWQQKQLKQAS
jgi:hypothetical protein